MSAAALCPFAAGRLALAEPEEPRARAPLAPEPPEHDLPLLKLIARLRSNGVAAWPRRAYQEMFVHRRCLGRDAYLLNDPDEARRVLRADVDLFERPLGFRRLYRPIFGGGLLLAEGERWKQQRRRLAPAFTARHVDGLIPRFRAAGERLLGRLDGAGEANLSRLFLDTSVEAVGSAAFSMSLDPLSNRIAAFRDAYFRRDAKVSVFDHLAEGENDFFLRWGSRARHGRQGQAIVEEMVRAHRPRAIRGDSQPDVIDVLQDAGGDGHATLTGTDIRDEVATMLGTGLDTAGRSMFWAALLLATHPRIQAKVRAELRRHPPARVTVLGDFDRWPWLRASLAESMRLYPPLQIFVRVPLAPVEICGRTVAPGSYVSVSPWVMHRHRTLWDHPEAFRPDRFLGEPHGGLRRRGFIPFGIGQRTCIGVSFAMTEVTLILAQLFERFEISLDDERPVTPVSVVTTVPSHEPLFRLRPVEAGE